MHLGLYNIFPVLSDISYEWQEWQRKEQLYGQIIALLDRSKLWEYSVPLCKELCDLYENR